jgi:hypothetical protein
VVSARVHMAIEMIIGSKTGKKWKETVVTAVKVAEKMALMVGHDPDDPIGRRSSSEEGKLIQMHFQKCSAIGIEVNVENLTAILNGSVKENVKDRMPQAKKLKEALVIRSSVVLSDNGNELVKLGEKAITEFKIVFLKELARDFGGKMDTTKAKADKSAPGVDRLSAVERQTCEPQQLIDLGKEFGPQLDSLKESWTVMNAAHKNYVEQKTDWVFKHPVEARFPDLTVRCAVLVSELAMLNCLALYGAKTLGGALKKEVTAMQVRNVVETQITPCLMKEVKKHI